MQVVHLYICLVITSSPPVATSMQLESCTILYATEGRLLGIKAAGADYRLVNITVNGLNAVSQGPWHRHNLFVRINGTLPDFSIMGDEEKSERAAEVRKMERAANTSCSVFTRDSRQGKTLASTYNLKGLSYDSLGVDDQSYYGEAIECFTKAIELDRNFASAYLNKGYSLGAYRRYTEALVCFKQAKDKFEKTETTAIVEAHRNIAFINSTLPNPDHKQARSEFDIATAKAPYFSLVDEAIVLDKKNEQKGKNSAYPYYNKGYTFYLQKKFQKAKECFDQAITRFMYYADAWYIKGVCLYWLQKEREEKSQANRDLNEYEKVISCFDVAIECFANDRKSRNFSYVWFNKGLVLAYLKTYEEAIECFDEATKKEPALDEAWNSKGVALHSLERYEEAIECFDEAIRCFDRLYRDKLYEDNTVQLVKTQLANTWFNKGLSYDSLSREGSNNYKALDCFDNALRYFNDDQYKHDDPERTDFNILQTCLMRAQSKCNLQLYWEALDDLRGIDQKIKNCNEDSTDIRHLKALIYDIIGICYYHLGTLYDADTKKNYCEAINCDPQLPEAHYNLAVLYNRQNKHDEAKQELDNCLGIDRNFYNAAAAKDKLGSPPQYDWYSWWFRRDKGKQILGILLISAMLAPFIVFALVIYDVYFVPHKGVVLTDFIGKNAASLIAGLTLTIGALIGVLLLPSLQRFKVATLEFQALPTTLAKNVELKTSLPRHKPVIFSMPIKSKPEFFRMVLLYYSQNILKLEFFYSEMPLKVSISTRML